MARHPGLVIPEGLEKELHKLGFTGKTPRDVVSQAVRFAKDVARSVSLGGAHAPTRDAINKLNQMQAPLDRLAMAQPVSSDVGSTLVRHKIIPPGKTITFQEASEIVSRHLGEVQAGLMSQRNLVIGGREGSFGLELRKSVLERLSKQAAAGDADAKGVLKRVELARELATATNQAFRQSRIRVGIMEPRGQKNPHRLRLARRGMR